MSKCIALLRAINVGGTGKVKMADLRAMFAAGGFADAETVVQTGNVVFGAADADTGELERRLEQAASEQLGLNSDFILRSAEEWKAVVAGNPFADFAADNPTFMVVAFAKADPDAEAIAALHAATDGLPESLEVVGREIYVMYPEGQGRSKLDLAKIERKHPTVRATARNWNTVLKVAALL